MLIFLCSYQVVFYNSVFQNHLLFILFLIMLIVFINPAPPLKMVINETAATNNWESYY